MTFRILNTHTHTHTLPIRIVTCSQVLFNREELCEFYFLSNKNISITIKITSPPCGKNWKYILLKNSNIEALVLLLIKYFHTISCESPKQGTAFANNILRGSFTVLFSSALFRFYLDNILYTKKAAGLTECHNKMPEFKETKFTHSIKIKIIDR